MRREELRVEALKTIGGTVLGLAVFLGGWLIFYNNGFYSAMVFFIGTLMIPVGILTLLSAIAGEFGTGPRTIIAVYIQERRIRAAARAPAS